MMQNNTELEKKLFEAARHFDIEAIEDLVIKQGVDINALRDSDDQTAFTIVVGSYYLEMDDKIDENNPPWDKDSYWEFVPESNVPFEDRDRYIIPILKRLIELGADIDAPHYTFDADAFRDTAFIIAIDRGDPYMIRFLLRNGADPNQDGCFPVDGIEPYTYAFWRTSDFQYPFYSTCWDEFKRGNDIEKLILEFGGQRFNEVYLKQYEERQYQPECNFEYKLTGHGIAHMSFEVNGKRFETRLGRDGRDIRSILYALYLISPCIKLNEDESEYVRPGCIHEDGWIVLYIGPESTDYTLSFQRTGERSEMLQIRVMENDKVLLLEECRFKFFLYDVVKSCDEMLKKHGLIGYSKTFCPRDGEFDINVFLTLKKCVMSVVGFTYDWDDDKRLCSTDYEKELAILAMVM